MAIHPEVRALLDAMAAAPGPQLHQLAPAEARAAYDRMAAGRVSTDSVASTEDRTIPGPAGDLPVRVYRPAGEGLLPAVVLFHGGGWVVGSIASHDALCTSLAARSGAVVVSVGYRLSPEAPFPGPLDDCTAALGWVAANADELDVDAGRLAVAGDSAGGNLAAAVALRARDEGGPPIAFQLLVYPVVDHSFSQASYRENGEGYFLTADAMRWFSAHYLGGANPTDPTDPLAAPLHHPDLSGLPPALVLTAGLDPLRDEGEAYAAALAAAGVAVDLRRHDGMIHGFLAMHGVLSEGDAALDACAAALRDALAAPA